MRPRRLTAVGILASIVTLGAQSPATPRAAAADVLPFKATETTLANGLKVIILPTGFPNLVSLQIPVQTGSRNEVEPGKSGFAHFFEHLMFRGTPNTPPEVFRAVMTKAGSRDNAGTGDDATRFYATFAKEDLDPVLRVYADMFQHLAYSESDFKTEARAILGEYNKNSADPMEKLFEVERDHFYQAHTYKHTTMGFIQDIENMPNEYRVLEGVLPAVVSPALYDRHRRRRCHPGGGAAHHREILGGLERGHRSTHGYSQGTASTRSQVRACAMGQRHAAHRLRGIPRPGLRGRQQGHGGDGHARGVVFRSHVGSLQETCRHRTEGGRAVRESADERGPLDVHDRRQGQEGRGRVVRARRGSQDDCRGTRRDGGPARGCQVVRPLQPGPDVRQHRARRVHRRVVCLVQAIVRHGQSLLQDHRHTLAGRSSEHREKVLHQQRAHRRDVVP